MKKRLGILGAAAAASLLTVGLGGTASATDNCAGASSATPDNAIAGPVYGSPNGPYAGVEGTAPSGQGGYVEVSAYSPDSAAIRGSSSDGSMSFKVGLYPCVSPSPNTPPAPTSLAR